MSSNVGFFVHPRGVCESTSVGAGCQVWAFAHVLAGARLGCDCNICDGVFIENDVELGNRVTVKNYVALYDGLRVQDDVFIGPGVSFANDRFPRSKRHVSHPVTLLERGCSIGAGAVILPGVTISSFALVAAGAVVTRDVAPFTLVKGNPARPAGQVCICGAPLKPTAGRLACTSGDWCGLSPEEDMQCSAW